MHNRLWLLFGSAFVMLHSLALADLPDLRGKTFYFASNFRVTGTALGQNIEEIAPNGDEIDHNDGGRIIFANTGPEDNSQLTAQIPLPTFAYTVNGVTYAGCANPTITMTGSFNRATGAFELTGTRTGTSILDLGVYDIPDLGVNRALMRMRDIGVHLRGEGRIVNGEFRLQQTGGSTYPVNNVTFREVGGLTPAPALGLVAPSSCSFPLLAATVSDFSFYFENWEARQARVAGVLTLTELSANALARPIRFDFRTPGTQTVRFSRTISVSPNGAYTLFDIEPGLYDVAAQGTGADGSTYLRKVIPGVDVRPEDVLNANAALLPGDIAQDNLIDLFDLVALFDAYGASDNRPEGPPDAEYAPNSDLTGDGTVDLFDLVTLFNVYGEAGDD